MKSGVGPRVSPGDHDNLSVVVQAPERPQYNRYLYTWYNSTTSTPTVMSNSSTALQRTNSPHVEAVYCNALVLQLSRRRRSGTSLAPMEVRTDRVPLLPRVRPSVGERRKARTVTRARPNVAH